MKTKLDNDTIHVTREDHGHVFSFGVLTPYGYEKGEASLLTLLAEEGKTLETFLNEQGFSQWRTNTVWLHQEIRGFWRENANGSDLVLFPHEIANQPDVINLVSVHTYPAEHRLLVIAIVRNEVST